MTRLQTRVTDRLGCTHPILGFSPSREVVAAVSRSGGCGVLAGTVRTPETIANDITWLNRELGDKPFGVDLVFPASVPASVANLESLEEQIPEEHLQFVRGLFERNQIPPPTSSSERRGGIAAGGLLSQENARKQLDAVLSSDVRALFSGLGSPAFALEAAHARGMVVGGLVGKVRQAQREIEAGVDMIVAQGYDAGGHTGEIGTFTLVPRVVAAAKASGTPVLLAGGVGRGAHLAAALALGAEGVWCGSLWLASEESDFDRLIKEKLVTSTEEDTVRTRALTGKPARMLRTKYTEAWDAEDAPRPLPMPLQGLLNADLQAAVREHQMEDWMGTPVGQMVGNVRAVRPVAEIIDELVAEAEDRLAALVS